MKKYRKYCLKFQMVAVGLFLIFSAYNFSIPKEQLCVFDTSQGGPPGCKDMNVTVKEIKRVGQASVVHVRVVKRGTYAGTIVFQKCCFSRIAKARGFRYFVTLVEKDLNDCTECEWSTSYVIGFLNSSSGNLKTLFPRYYRDDQKHMIIDINKNSIICGFLPLPTGDFFNAVYTNDVKTVKVLLAESGDLVNEKNKDGYRPLHISVMEGHLEMIEILVSAGADINGKGKWGWAPLHLAVRNNKIDTVDLLLRLGADPNIKMEMGNTPLHNAVYRGNIRIAALMLTYGAKIGETDFSGNTPLHGAAARGKLEMVKFLLKKGVGLKKKNFHGQSPLDMARKGKATEVIKLLRAEQGSGESNDFR